MQGIHRWIVVVLLTAALQQDPELLDRAMRDRVVLSTPSTLVALLHAVAYGWKEERLAKNAEEISALGKEMHDRLVTWIGHQAALGSSLSRSVEAFNAGVGSLESRVLVSARRFKDLGIAGVPELPTIEPIDVNLRPLSPSDSVAAESAKGENRVG